MRIIVILLSFAAMGFAAESKPIPGYAEAQKELSDKIQKLKDDFGKKEADYYKKYIDGKLSMVPLPKLPADPKESERKELYELNVYNRQVEGYKTYIDPHAWVAGSWPSCFWRQVGTLPDFRGSQEVAADVPAEKEKKKSKITATLSDGTKVE